MENSLRRNNKKNYLNKDTRWDRIRKKHINSVCITSESVKKIFGMNFINENQMKYLNGDRTKYRQLDPTLVMNMRHEIIRRPPKPIIDPTNKRFDPQKMLQMEKLQNHNNIIETKYLDNELRKFKEEILFSRPKTTHQINNNNNGRFHLNNMNNEKIIDAINQSADAIQDFYLNSYDAAIVKNQLNEKSNEMIPIAEHECLIQKSDQDGFNERSVQFDNFVEIIEYPSPSVSSPNCCIFDLDDSVNDDVINCLVEEEFNRKTKINIQIMPKEISLEMIGKQMKSDEEIDKVPLNSNVATPPKTITAKPIAIKMVDINDIKCNSLKIIKIDGDKIKTPSISNNQSVPIKSENILSLEQNTIITELFNQSVDNMSSRKIFLQKYFQKWIHFTTIEKISNQNLLTNDSRIRKIEMFLTNIRLEKKKLTAKNAGQSTIEQNKKTSVGDTENPINLARKYNNKLKIQQDIIELQKLKLDRQERMITELKFTKITDQTKESKELIKQELKQVIRNGCAKLRSKAKCLQMVGNLKDAEDIELAKIQANGVPKFLIEMEARAMERNERHKQARERRETLDRQKEELRLAAEEAKRQQDEEAKRQRIEELREKRRQEKLLKIQKENDRLRQIANVQKANLFYRNKLLTTLGMDRFKMLIKLKKRNQRKADQFYQFILVKYSLKYWHAYVEQVWAKRKEMADLCYRHHVKKITFAIWKKYNLIQNSKMLVAIDWYEMKLSERIFCIWDGYTKEQKLIEEVKLRQATAHYNWHLKWRVIEHWQRLHAILKIEKETDERRQRWRMKIWELLPDYTPNSSTDH